MIIHSPLLSLEPYPEVPLHHFLAQAAIRYPKRPALIFVDGQQYSYHRLFQASSSLARMLQESGLQRSERAAIYSPNCPEYAVVAYGTSMAGGTPTTLNPLYRAREVVYQLADAGAKVLFYHPMVRSVVDEAQPELPRVALMSLAEVWTIADHTSASPIQWHLPPVRISPPCFIPAEPPDCRRGLC
jgi:acyl-CoA synthetase (AMP-forming)/AMP-acid ligase II